jgi:hypothetical protein
MRFVINSSSLLSRPRISFGCLSFLGFQDDYLKLDAGPVLLCRLTDKSQMHSRIIGCRCAGRCLGRRQQWRRQKIGLGKWKTVQTFLLCSITSIYCWWHAAKIYTRVEGALKERLQAGSCGRTVAATRIYFLIYHLSK